MRQKHSRFRFRQVPNTPGQLKFTFAVAFWLLASGALSEFFLTTSTSAATAVLFNSDQPPTPAPHQNGNVYNYRCFSDRKDPVSTNFNVEISHVGLLVSDHVIHQLITRIFAIVLREKLNYQNVLLIPYKFGEDVSDEQFEVKKLGYTLNLIKHHSQWTELPMINLGLWMPPLGHGLIPPTVYEAGSSITASRYGWFAPEYNSMTASNSSMEALDYSIFMHPTSPQYKKFLINDTFLNYLRKNTDWEEFISPACQQRTCVTLLAEHKYDTAFVQQQIMQTNASVNILWLGRQFKEKVTWLYKLYDGNETHLHSNFILIHWTPSDVINGDITFRQVTMPMCEELKSLQRTNCKYELTPVLKYFSKSFLTDFTYKRMIEELRRFDIVDAELTELLSELGRQRSLSSNAVLSTEDIYNAAACNWLKHNTRIYSKLDKDPKLDLAIGGIFPFTETSRGHHNLEFAARRAVKAINTNNTVLAKYKLELQEHDGQCKADVVMKAFIHYYNTPYTLGVLGPACSETVEPIAGISQHTNMAVISYSAEGGTFVDRQTYPYFFRTIGSNRQYEDVYIKLMHRFGWRRVAALTEDGQKHTEYISHMEAAMKQNGLELILNKKFLSDVTSKEMNKHLLDLKQRHAKIIIADVHTRNAELALCEAYKLSMTASQGYVWFLPSWLSKNTFNITVNNSCTSEELKTAFEGHLSIMHTPFAHSESIMQENISVGHWLHNYKKEVKNVSDYTGFAYDAVWAYTLATDKLLRENGGAVNSLRKKEVVNRFVELIWETDFEGLSGRVRFGQGGSRITDLDIMQWRSSQFVSVGKFHPEVVGIGANLRTHGGELKLYEGTIKWFSGGDQPPGDGTYDCSFSGLAELFATDCDSAALIFSAMMCLMVVVVLFVISFFFWKRRYDSKLKKSAKIMKTFGIDLLSPSRSNSNSLDKWEIPKENVVVNRRLGEGAFGTVYGGEAQLKSAGWTAVAVKTLKAGASMEDRLDFLSEAEAMKRFNHKNIVKLLGVCLQSEPIYTIMEFMLYGDLKTYLLARRHLVSEKSSDDSDISPKRLTMYAMDVANGLMYLAQQKYVHRDIACRNCLVNAQRVVKLGDFGMARPTFESDYYRFNRKGMLPVRWMAPESLGLGMFTPSSDVWAFGIVLYEIITFGSFPYQGLTNNQVFEHVKSGKTLEIPTGVKPHLEGLIKACWSKETKKRPTAAEIVDYISNCPRLLTPCLDFPGASVEMPETDSDELELLPKVRKCPTLKLDSTLDILAQTSNADNFDRCSEFGENIEMPEHTSIQIPTEAANVPPMNADSFSLITPDGYSIMSPLLMHQRNECSDSSQTRLLKKPSLEALKHI